MLARAPSLPALFAALTGSFLGLVLLKFGNPVILDRLIEPPGSLMELIFQAWPAAWAYVFLGVVAVAALTVAKLKVPRPRWLVALPLVWLTWQFLAAVTTADAGLTRVTLAHFTATVLGFYLGLFALAGVRPIRWCLTCLLIGFLLMLWVGLDQHYGGLEATRRYFYSQPGWERAHPEHLKRIASDRIFSTLLYPNALAGVLLLLGPAMVVTTWHQTTRLTKVIRGVVTGLVAYATLACLVWSGSKAGWLIALAMGLVWLLHRPIPPKLRVLLIALVLTTGLVGFAWRFSTYFARGATSVGARFEYWRAAVKTAVRHPIWGAGPGTFAVAYRSLKPPEAEMAQLAHNDYLEQACDSGWAGAVAYAVFVGGSVLRLRRPSLTDSLSFAVWMGLLGWALQSLVEFGLYIPAVGWIAFWLLGWLWGRHSSTTELTE